MLIRTTTNNNARSPLSQLSPPNLPHHTTPHHTTPNHTSTLHHRRRRGAFLHPPLIYSTVLPACTKFLRFLIFFGPKIQILCYHYPSFTASRRHRFLPFFAHMTIWPKATAFVVFRLLASQIQQQDSTKNKRQSTSYQRRKKAPLLPTTTFAIKIEHSIDSRCMIQNSK